MRPVLKSAVWERVESSVRVVYDLRDQFVIEDADGGVEALLGLLAQGGRTVPELAAALGVPVDDVTAAIAMLNDCGLVEDGDPLPALPAEVQERHYNNLAFFESFGSLSRGRTDLCRSLWDAHVLVLGTGGFGSNVLAHLAGLGVGRLTLVDNPQLIAELLDLYRPDAVVDGVDTPDQIDAWVNLACVPAGIPFVRGGMWVTQGVVWSVDPGRSACVTCRFEPPAYAARPIMIDFAAGCVMHHTSWSRDPHCTVCAAVPGDLRPARQTTLAERR